MISQAVILCGGRGERLRPITDSIPKPMVPVCGRPFVSYLIEVLSNNGITDIVLSVGYLKSKFRYFEGARIGGYRDRVRLVDCDPESSSRSVLKVPELQDRFIVANGDVFPILKWNEFLKLEGGVVAIKIFPERKDVGIAIVKKRDVESGLVDCGNLKGMMEVYDRFVCTGNDHIGTPEGLRLAEEHMRMWWRQ